MKPFDLEAAKNGAPICTRDGRDVRIVCFDSKSIYPIIALIRQNNDEEVLDTYTLDGKDSKYKDSLLDLFMKPVKEKGWINLYHNPLNNRITSGNNIYETKEIAMAESCGDYFTTIQIEWEY